ncbi:hypothetical protein H4R21_004993 [Coemansia helicoidea]|uniref:Uncharacterized protein n=1 Tax=Coemansia helicoidea TaxID=1286919 RepID=A0ACC1KVJ1_9FUNG|nr:hypothetical protein H4R21_004993 [Coemansia helicoidea]
MPATTAEIPTLDAGDDHNICVFCATRDGKDAAFAEAATELGREVVRAGYGLVYGGSVLGMMGRVAVAARDSGGDVLAVMMEYLLEREGWDVKVGRTQFVTSIQECRDVMNARSRGFVVLPGGIGTFAEIIQALDWAFFFERPKPVVVVNTGGFYDPLRALINSVFEQELIESWKKNTVIFCDSPAEAVAAIARHDNARLPAAAAALSSSSSL